MTSSGTNQHETTFLSLGELGHVTFYACFKIISPVLGNPISVSQNIQILPLFVVSQGREKKTSVLVALRAQNKNDKDTRSQVSKTIHSVIARGQVRQIRSYWKKSLQNAKRANREASSPVEIREPPRNKDSYA